MSDTQLSSQEKAALTRLLDPDSSVEVIVPDDADPDKLWSTLLVTCKGLNWAEHTSAKLKPILGRLLLLIQRHPEAYKKHGYATFEDLVNRGIRSKFGVSRAALYEAKRLASAFPTTSPETIAEVGITNMLTLSRFTSEQEPSFKRYLAVAKRLPAAEFKEWAAEKQLIEAGDASPGVIVIHTSAKRARLWRQFVKRGWVQSVCGSADPGQILERMMEECSVEWQNQAQETG